MDVDDLVEGHKYHFKVRAVNKYGKSDPLERNKDVLAKNPFGPPSKPGRPTVTDFDSDWAELEWRKPDVDGGSPISGYIIEKKDKFR